MKILCSFLMPVLFLACVFFVVAQTEDALPEAPDYSSYTFEELVAEIARVELEKEKAIEREVRRAEAAAEQKLIYADKGRAYLEKEAEVLHVWRDTAILLLWLIAVLIMVLGATGLYIFKLRGERKRMFQEPAGLVESLNPVFLSLILKTRKRCSCGEDIILTQLPLHMESCTNGGTRDLIKEFLGNMRTVHLFAPPKLKLR